MKSIVSAAQGYLLANALGDVEGGPYRMDDFYFEPIIAWELDDGVFSRPVTLALVGPCEWGFYSAIVCPDGRVVADLCDAIYDTIEGWLDVLAENELKRRLIAGRSRA